MKIKLIEPKWQNWSIGQLLWDLSGKMMAILFCLGLGSAAQAEINLTFGTYAADKPTHTVRQFKPFLSYLAKHMSEELGEPVKIRMKIAKTYEQGISDLTTGAVDFARFGPASYVAAKAENSEIEIIAMESKKGSKRFKGVIAVHSESTFSTMADLKGQNFAFGDQLSTIGRYLAQSLLLEEGISAAELSGFQYLGRHDLVGTAVAAKTYAAGALKESTFKKQVKAGLPIKALVKFDNVTKPWIARSEMESRVLIAMRKVFLEANDKTALAKIAKEGFLDSSDAEYDFIRQAIIHSEQF